MHQSEMGASEGPVGQPFTILYVCTGNTCRSPLAEVLTRAALARRGWNHVTVRSAGIAASNGSGASGGSLRVAARHGLDLSEHYSAPLTAALVEESDLILGMAFHHVEAALEYGGQDKSGIITEFAARGDGDPSGVPDPFGGADAEYEAAFECLEHLVDGVLDQLEPILQGSGSAKHGPGEQ